MRPALIRGLGRSRAFNPDELLRLRTIESDLEGHPTPQVELCRCGDGLARAKGSTPIGLAINAKYLDRSSYRTLRRDGRWRVHGGSNWEAAEIARHYQLDNLCAIVDINRLGQSDPTLLQHDVETYRSRWSAFGWNAIPVTDTISPSSWTRSHKRLRRKAGHCRPGPHTQGEGHFIRRG